MAQKYLKVVEEFSKDKILVIYAPRFERVVGRLKKRSPDIFNRVFIQVEKVIREPEFGKPLRYSLKNRRRIHVGSFVLVYEFYNGELRFIDFDHHDKIYKV